MLVNSVSYGEALQRLRKYVKERKAMLGLDPELIHSLHSGTDREAELLLSDLELALSETAGWVPVEKALPDNSDPVLVFQGNASHMRRVAYYDTIGATGWRWCGFDSGERCDPDAWRPIPTFSRLSERPR